LPDEIVEIRDGQKLVSRQDECGDEDQQDQNATAFAPQAYRSYDALLLLAAV